MNTSWKVSRARPHHRYVLICGFGILILLASMPLWTGRADLRLATEMACYLTLAMMWNLLAGYAGVMSIGQQLFVGCGGYIVFVLAGMAGVPVLPAIVIAGLLAGLLALPTGLILFRLSGAFFAIGSWVVAEMAAIAISLTPKIGGGSGLSFPVRVARELGSANERAALFWWAALALAVMATAVCYFWARSPRGLALTAMRDNEVAAQSLGVNIKRSKLAVYIVTACMTGAAGAVIFLTKLRISPTAAFDVGEWTANIIFIVVIGGLAHIEGAIIGTFLFFVLRYFLADFGTWYLMALGVIAIITILRFPSGLWGIIHQRFGLEIFPVRRHVGRIDKSKDDL